jgi:hypothetical protein
METTCCNSQRYKIYEQWTICTNNECSCYLKPTSLTSASHRIAMPLKRLWDKLQSYNYKTV